MNVKLLCMERTKKVAVVLPSAQSRHILERYSKGRYEFHWLTDANAPAQDGTNDPMKTTKFDPILFIERAVKYVKENKIDAVLYFTDFAGLVGAIICEETGLPGPSVESVFLCIHKYYSRKAEPSKLWCEAIDLELKLPNPSIKYPCCVKAPFLGRTMLFFVVTNESEMEVALASCRQELLAWSSIWRPVFEKYIDTKKYPLALKYMVIAEELVLDGSQHCVEGWVDDKGKFHVWVTSDEGYFMKPQKTVDGYFVPSQAKESSLKKLKAVALSFARNLGLRNTFFNVELWCRNGGKVITVTEINNRIAYVFHPLYIPVYKMSTCTASLHLACREYEQVTKLCPIEHQQGGRDTLVGGQFLVQLHVRCEQKASEAINFEAVKSIQEEALRASEPDLFGCHGQPGIDLRVNEDTLLRPVGSCGYLVIVFHVFKPTFHEVIFRAEEIRNRLVKVKDLLPYERQKEYYVDCCGLSL